MANEETLEDGKSDEELEKEIMEVAKKSNEDEENVEEDDLSLIHI